MDGSMVSVEGRRRRARFASDEVELLLVVLDLVFDHDGNMVLFLLRYL